MPVITPRRNSHSHYHANLPITLLTALALIAALIYLQLAYAISWLLRPFYNSSQEFPPLRHTIERAEKLTVNIILGIVPTSFYRSPPVSGLLHMHEDSAHRATSAPPYTYETASHTKARAVIPAQIPQCYPENSVERMGTRDSRLLREIPPDSHARESSVYDTVKKYATTGKQRISVVEMQMHQSTLSQSVPVPDIPQPQKSPAASFDGAQEASMHLFPSDGSTNSMTLRMTRRSKSKSRSMESYPGKFPVSDGLEYSNLARASANFRERGTTSVRPFSDY
jgi:hypothetical protein